MEREALIKYVADATQMSELYERSQVRLDDYELNYRMTKKGPLYTPIGYLTFGLLSKKGLIFFIIYSLLLWYFTNFSVPFLLYGGVLGALLVLNHFGKTKPNHLSKVSACQVEVKNEIKFSEKVLGSLKDIAEEDIIPVAYLHHDVLHKFNEYLVNKRADTIKECGNLFEQEIQMQQLKESLVQNIQEATGKLEEKLSKINHSVKKGNELQKEAASSLENISIETQIMRETIKR